MFGRDKIPQKMWVMIRVAGGGEILAADGCDRLLQGGLVSFDLHHVMRLLVLHQIRGGVALAMQRIPGDNLSRDLQGIE